MVHVRVRVIIHDSDVNLLAQALALSLRTRARTMLHLFTLSHGGIVTQNAGLDAKRFGKV